MIISQLKNEVNKKIYSDIIKSISKTTNIHYLDLTGLGKNEFNFPDLILEKLNQIGAFGKNYNAITNSRISSYLTPYIEYEAAHPGAGPIAQVNALLSNLGKLKDINLLVDPYMKFSDDRIILFGDVNFRLFDVKHQISDSIRKSLESKLEYNFNIIECVVLYIVHSTDCDSYKKYKSISRNIKIDSIID